MPVNFLGTVFMQGTEAIPYFEQIKSYVPLALVLSTLKYLFNGVTNTWERDLHGRVIIVTGGTSGVGAVIVEDLARRGAQVIILVRSISDGWLVESINDLRERTQNPLIYVEEADLASLHSIRVFATAWLNNSPPRRLDMIICCAGVATPPSVERRVTSDGLEEQYQVNYLGHYHLLTLLSPALRAQPADRDVRVILTTCFASILADFDIEDMDYSSRRYPIYQPWKVLGSAKLSLTMFAYEFQNRLNAYKRPDGAPTNVSVMIVDPGMMRSPSFKRFASFGSILGLLIYLILWPLWWLVLKSSIRGAQSLLNAAMSPEYDSGKEMLYISQCKPRNPPPRKELADAELHKELYDKTELFIKQKEKELAVERKRRGEDKPTSATATAKATQHKAKTTETSRRRN